MLEGACLKQRSGMRRLEASGGHQPFCPPPHPRILPCKECADRLSSSRSAKKSFVTCPKVYVSRARRYPRSLDGSLNGRGFCRRSCIKVVLRECPSRIGHFFKALQRSRGPKCSFTVSYTEFGSDPPPLSELTIDQSLPQRDRTPTPTELWRFYVDSCVGNRISRCGP